MKKLRILWFAMLAATAFPAFAGSGDSGTLPFSHVYYLFIAHSKGCEECYVPMVITRAPIDAKSLAGGSLDSVVIVTYERDSIWEIKQGPQKLEVPPEKGSALIRHLRWGGNDYRYQEVERAEALRLLEHPMGTVAISRPASFKPPTDALKEKDVTPILIHDLSLAQGQ